MSTEVIKDPSKIIKYCVGDIYALRKDGVNDYVENNVTTPFIQWERDVPWTFFCSLINSDPTVLNELFDCRIVPPSRRGIVVAILESGRGNLLIVEIRNYGTGHLNDIRVESVDAVPSGSKVTVQITYDGSSTAAGVKMYINNVESATTIIADTLSATIINNQNLFYIGADIATGIVTAAGDFRWLSFVDYVKNAIERAEDHNSYTQSDNSGNYLLAVDFNQTSGLQFYSVGGNLYLCDVLGQPEPGDWVIW